MEDVGLGFRGGVALPAVCATCQRDGSLQRIGVPLCARLR
jgi:hypothetical protein